MSLLEKVLPFGGLLEKAFDRLFPNPEERAKAQLEVLKMEQEGAFRIYAGLDQSDRNQAEINKIDAASDNFFQYGWRSAAGWVCVLGLAAQFFGVPLLSWIAANTLQWSAPPKLDVSELIVLLCGMLGLGGFRTYEKIKR